MISFKRSWSDEIADVSEISDYQNATISIRSPHSPPGDYDIETGTWTGGESAPELYSGRARVKEIRWGVYQKGEPLANPSDRKSVRVQVPSADFNERLVKGTVIIVTECAENPELETHVLYVTSSLQGSSTASRTYECSVDSDTVIQNGG